MTTKTILEVVRLSTEYLKQKGIDSPRRQAEELISDVLGVARMQLYLEFDRPLISQELDKCRESLSRRGKGEPASYISGKVEFHGCTLKVNRHVLIPRQETGILVDMVIKQLATQSLEGKILWDVCCGSGCIGIALKKRFPELQVLLSDFSADALDVAKENARQNDVEVTALQGDLLAPFAGKKAHYFICNPPYVSEAEYPTLDPEVRDYEPRLALVAGNGGLEFYERLSKELMGYLHPSAMGCFEIGHTQGCGVQALFSGHPWKQNRIEKDWAGHDRFFFLELE